MSVGAMIPHKLASSADPVDSDFPVLFLLSAAEIDNNRFAGIEFFFKIDL